MNFFKALLLVAGATNGMCRTLPDAFPSKLDAVATRIDISNPLGGQQHGELRTLSPPQQGCQSEIDTLVACLLASSTGQVCISCVLSQDAVLFENSGTANCTDIRTIMCDAWNNLCPCSPCEDLWETYYIDCGYTASCGVMTCDEDCQILLDEADNCMALAPPSCGDCVQGAVAGIPTSALSCLEFEAAICEITKTNCSCSPCEEQLQEYFFSCASSDCPGLGPCQDSPLSSDEECQAALVNLEEALAKVVECFG